MRNKKYGSDSQFDLMVNTVNGGSQINSNEEKNWLKIVVYVKKQQPQPLLHEKCNIRAKYNKDLPWLEATLKKYINWKYRILFNLKKLD